MVLCNIDTDNQAHPPLGIAYIASYLKKYLGNIDISIVDREKDMLKAVLKEKPDMIGISSVTKEFSNTIELIKEVKKKINIPVILGGPHISALPNTLPDVFDIGVVGEGEETFFELMKIFLDEKKFSVEKLKNIKGICYHDGDVKITERRKFIEPLDKIPFPARDLFNMERDYLVRRNSGTGKRISRATHILTSRGCPFNCRFCASSKFWEHRIRYFSAEYVVNEIKEILDSK